LFDRPHKFQQLAATLYPEGYYLLKSRKEFESQVLQSLGLWMDLEDNYPQSASDEERISYARLYERFKLALASALWSEAEEARQKMFLFNLASAENLLF